LARPDSEVTLLTIDFNGPNNLVHTASGPDFYAGDKVDFQVKAMLGYYNFDVGGPFKGDESDWSPTQTITLSENNTSSIIPTVAPSVPEFSWLIILSLFLSILSIAVLVRSRKISRRITQH
jgi:hypothetical protein